MTYRIFRPIIIGILLGAALFIMPFFFIRAVVFFLIIGALFRFFFFRRWYRGYGPWYNPDNIRNMSDEEYSRFRQRFNGGCYPYNNTARSQGDTIDIKID